MSTYEIQILNPRSLNNRLPDSAFATVAEALSTIENLKKRGVHWATANYRVVQVAPDGTVTAPDLTLFYLMALRERIP
jgi:hypothetical protein